MFYCLKCGNERNWPTHTWLHQSVGLCELCKKTAACFDIPSKELPPTPSELTEEPEPEVVEESVEEIRNQWRYREDADEHHLYEPGPFKPETMHRHIGLLLHEFDGLLRKHLDTRAYAASKTKDAGRLRMVLDDANRVITLVTNNLERKSGFTLASLYGYRLRHHEFFFDKPRGCTTCLYGNAELTGGVCDNPKTGGGEISDKSGFSCPYWAPWWEFPLGTILTEKALNTNISLEKLQRMFSKFQGADSVAEIRAGSRAYWAVIGEVKRRGAEHEVRIPCTRPTPPYLWGTPFIIDEDVPVGECEIWRRHAVDARKKYGLTAAQYREIYGSPARSEPQ